MNSEKILLDIKILYNPQAIICNTNNNDLCKKVSDFFSIPLITEFKNEERILIIGTKRKYLIIEDERLW